MSGEAEDLLLALMQVPDIEPPPPSETTDNALSKLKPYPTHKGCGGMVLAQAGRDEEEDAIVVCFKCQKCGWEEYVNATGIILGPHGSMIDAKAPDWVEKPFV